MQRNPKKVDVKGWLLTSLVYAIALLYEYGSPSCYSHLDSSDGVRSLEKPSESIQHTWNVWIWHHNQWNWQKTRELAWNPSRTVGEPKKIRYFVHITPSNGVRSLQKPSQLIAAHLQYMDLTPRIMKLAINHKNQPENPTPNFIFSLQGFSG